ncbi:hypothetical protein NQ317_000782 [Molorchus minor]|uniref:Transposable element P transposase-like RNase H C-terminal domain-containing protein n=1 Tax=Molorchus minor TaxID=1323400 RepID=A0ABQ9J0H7_9CUCU|nr:hypothetical protein NQ317_000782 [Molorchus minor]
MTSPSQWKPPSQKGWLHNFKALPQLWKHLQSLGVDALRTRALNQDALENLFGGIRSGCGCNENPTTSQFVSSPKTQVINGLANRGSKGTNCEEDDMVLLSSLRSFIESGSKDAKDPDTFNPNATASKVIYDNQNTKNLEELVAMGTVETLSVAYVAGFISKRILTTVTCKMCTSDLCGDALQPCNQFISLKEFSNSNSKLFYPSEKLVVAIGRGITILECHLQNLLKRK